MGRQARGWSLPRNRFPETRPTSICCLAVGVAGPPSEGLEPPPKPVPGDPAYLNLLPGCGSGGRIRTGTSRLTIWSMTWSTGRTGGGYMREYIGGHATDQLPSILGVERLQTESARPQPATDLQASELMFPMFLSPCGRAAKHQA
jgi:hypothetical protein